MTCLLLLACEPAPQGQGSRTDLPVEATAIPAAPAASPQPADVAAFVERRELCDHFRGEEPYDAERREFIGKNIAALCPGSDAALAALRRKYAGNRQVTDRLSRFELRIE